MLLIRILRHIRLRPEQRRLAGQPCDVTPSLHNFAMDSDNQPNVRKVPFSAIGDARKAVRRSSAPSYGSQPRDCVQIGGFRVVMSA